MANPRAGGLSRLQMQTLAALWLRDSEMPRHSYGSNACDFGGERYAACARTLAKYGLVVVDTISPRHKRYGITALGLEVAERYAPTPEALGQRAAGTRR